MDKVTKAVYLWLPIAGYLFMLLILYRWTGVGAKAEEARAAAAKESVAISEALERMRRDTDILIAKTPQTPELGLAGSTVLADVRAASEAARKAADAAGVAARAASSVWLKAAVIGLLGAVFVWFLVGFTNAMKSEVSPQVESHWGGLGGGIGGWRISHSVYHLFGVLAFGLLLVLVFFSDQTVETSKYNNTDPPVGINAPTGQTQNAPPDSVTTPRQVAPPKDANQFRQQVNGAAQGQGQPAPVRERPQ
jgi:hypothetical protein